MERVKGIEPLSSEWKSETLAVELHALNKIKWIQIVTKIATPEHERDES